MLLIGVVVENCTDSVAALRKLIEHAEQICAIKIVPTDAENERFTQGYRHGWTMAAKLARELLEEMETAK